MAIFDTLGGIYDRFNQKADYGLYKDFIVKSFREFAVVEKDYQPRAVDLGCGTGEMSLLLAKEGFDLIGVDGSEQMLLQAMNKAYENPELSLFFVKQDFRKLRMDAKANLFVSCYDCLNYLDSTEELSKVFEAVYSHLALGGLLIFDLNNLFRFESYYGDNVFVYKQNNAVLLWENHYNRNTETLHFEIESFIKQEKLYKRQSEVHKQRYFSRDTVSKLLEKIGFEILSISDDKTVFKSSEKAVRDFYVCKK
jgi:predicted TPR repeat methyltransferase